MIRTLIKLEPKLVKGEEVDPDVVYIKSLFKKAKKEQLKNLASRTLIRSALIYQKYIKDLEKIDRKKKNLDLRINKILRS